MRLSKLFIALCTVGFLYGTTATPAGAAEQKWNFGGIPGPGDSLVSLSSPIPASSEKVIFTVPNNQGFVLTTWCSGHDSVSLVGSTLGALPFHMATCQTFTPGIVIPKGEVLRCENSAGEAFPCLISGILVKEKKKFSFR